MKVGLYVLWDKTAQAVMGGVNVDSGNATATRSFGEVLANPETLPGKYPDQFDLLKIGELDTETAEIISTEQTTILRGAEWLERQKQLRERQHDESML